MGSLPLRVLPSKTAIVPVKRELMPSSQVGGHCGYIKRIVGIHS
jgi:hypothetical protein